MANSRLCSIPDCDKPHRAKGLCFMHYMRLRRNGHLRRTNLTENGEPEEYYRQIVMKYDGDECLLWPYAKYGSGYGAMVKDGKNGHVSRFVCEDTHGEPPTPDHQAAHSCGNGHLGCVTKRHLSWKTRVENDKDKEIHGTRPVGEKCSYAKLSEDDVRTILSLKGKRPQRSIAADYGVCQQAISKIHSRKNWRRIDIP